METFVFWKMACTTQPIRYVYQEIDLFVQSVQKLQKWRSCVYFFKGTAIFAAILT